MTTVVLGTGALPSEADWRARSDADTAQVSITIGLSASVTGMIVST